MFWLKAQAGTVSVARKWVLWPRGRLICIGPRTWSFSSPEYSRTLTAATAFRSTLLSTTGVTEGWNLDFVTFKTSARPEVSLWLTWFVADNPLGAVSTVFSQAVLWDSQVRCDWGGVTHLQRAKKIFGKFHARLWWAVYKDTVEGNEASSRHFKHKVYMKTLQTECWIPTCIRFI